MSWNEEDLSNYNRAESPWFHVEVNGKVDIGIKQGDDTKVGLQPWGMYKLVETWLESDHGLRKEQKEKLIKLLTK